MSIGASTLFETLCIDRVDQSWQMKMDGSDVFNLIDYYYCSMIGQIYINRDRVDFNRNRFKCNFRVLVSLFRFRSKLCGSTQLWTMYVCVCVCEFARRRRADLLA